MSTLQATPHVTPSLRNGLTAAIATLTVVIAIAVALVVAPGSTTTAHSVPSVATNNDTSAAYAPPHDYGVPRPTTPQRTKGITPNNQNSPSYTKAELYKAAR